MKSSPIKESHSYYLVVEGSDDKHTIINLLASHGWNWDRPDPYCPYVKDAGDVESAIELVPVLVKSKQRVGLVVDADLEFANRWTSIRDRMQKVNFALPETVSAGGCVSVVEDKRMGVWVMPDNQSRGKLEDFLALLVPQEDTCWNHAIWSVLEASKLGAPFKEKDTIKAQIHTWLAWREHPGRPFGTAIHAEYFNHNANAAAAFVTWMKRLFID